ncbi:MAG: hypothetical protein Q4Q62_08170 [Thermoplasmata archaeon]|nr:hypothetical protein [Thermoplasmata archaeon]
MNENENRIRIEAERLEGLGEEVWRYGWGFVVSDGEMAAFWRPLSDDPGSYNEDGTWTGWTTIPLKRTEELERMLADGTDPEGRCLDCKGRVMRRHTSIPVDGTGETLSYVVRESVVDGKRTTVLNRFYLTAEEACGAAARILSEGLAAGHDDVSVTVGYDRDLTYCAGGALSDMPEGYRFDVRLPRGLRIGNRLCP